MKGRSRCLLFRDSAPASLSGFDSNRLFLFAVSLAVLLLTRPQRREGNSRRILYRWPFFLVRPW